MSLRKLLAALFAATLLLAACGGGDDNDDDASTDTTEESDSTESTDESDSAESDTDSGDLGDLDDLGDLGDLGGLGDCLEFSLGYAGIFLGGLGALGGADEDQIAEYEAQLDELNAAVPDEVSDEFEVVSAAYTEYYEALANNSNTSDEVAEAGEALEADDVVEAQATIDKYLEEECS
jgi:hypothetical protein